MLQYAYCCQQLTATDMLRYGGKSKKKKKKRVLFIETQFHQWNSKVSDCNFWCNWFILSMDYQEKTPYGKQII